MKLKGIQMFYKKAVHTTQFVHDFYQKIGFQLEKIEKDYWAR